MSCTYALHMPGSKKKICTFKLYFPSQLQVFILAEPFLRKNGMQGRVKVEN